MEAIKTNTTAPLSFVLIALCTILACFGLFWLDWETKSILDLFKPGNLAALVVYFVPTFLTSTLLYSYLWRKKSPKLRIILSLLIGIPLGFILVICAFFLFTNVS